MQSKLLEVANELSNQIADREKQLAEAKKIKKMQKPSSKPLLLWIFE